MAQWWTRIHVVKHDLFGTVHRWRWNSSKLSKLAKAPLHLFLISFHVFRRHDDVIKWKHFPRYWPFVREFPSQRPVTRSFDVFFHLRLNKWLSKQPWGWWFETPACSLWRHRNGENGLWLKETLDCFKFPTRSKSSVQTPATRNFKSLDFLRTFPWRVFNGTRSVSLCLHLNWYHMLIQFPLLWRSQLEYVSSYV